MRILILVLILGYYGISITLQQYPVAPNQCNVQSDVSHNYRMAAYEFTVLINKAVALRGSLNFVFSPNSVWIMLAAIAEGSEPATQSKLFNILNLPDDPCLRLKYYELATTRDIPGADVNIKNNRVLLVDEGVTLNRNWYEFIVNNNLLQVLTAPIRYNPIATANEIKRIMSVRLPKLNLRGNSVLLDSMDYNGLWTTAFADAVIERAPFYNLKGQQIGAVDMMRVKRRARMGYLKNFNAKVLELPVGVDERYRWLFCVTIDNNYLTPILATITSETVFELFASLRSSHVLLDVAIPRLGVTSEIDMRTILEALGITELWTDPTVTRYIQNNIFELTSTLHWPWSREDFEKSLLVTTAIASSRYISNPPAFPSSYVQRSTLILNNNGVSQPQQEPEPTYSTRTGLEPILGRDFIADRPFLFALMDSETNTFLLSAAYTEPTYK